MPPAPRYNRRSGELNMARKIRWVAQAADVIRLQLPPDYVDRCRPDLAQVKLALLTVGHVMSQAPRPRAGPIPILDRRRRVRVWFAARRGEILGFAVECSYDGGRTFTNPLARYARFVR